MFSPGTGVKAAFRALREQTASDMTVAAVWKNPAGSLTGYMTFENNK